MTRTERTMSRLAWPLLAIGLIGLVVVVMILFRDNAERSARNAQQDRAIAALRGDNATLATGVQDLRGATSEANRRLKSAGKTPVTVPSVSSPAVQRGEAGTDGRDGRQGQRGPRGAVGAAGAAGLTITGPRGPAGATGATGPKGDTGSAGQNGRDGADSTVPGPRGEQGAQGEPGQSAYPFTFVFVMPGLTGDTTYTCNLTAPGETATCTS